jgi:hypothetical protein
MSGVEPSGSAVRVSVSQLAVRKITRFQQILSQRKFLMTLKRNKYFESSNVKNAFGIIVNPL